MTDSTAIKSNETNAPELLAGRMATIKPSPTLAVAARAKELKAQGQDVIGLGVGEPDFDTPDFAKEAGKAAIDAGKTKYTPVPGTPELRQTIVDKFKRENGLDFKPTEIVVATGGKQVLFNAFMATINPGDEVVIPAPYWVSYPEMVGLFGGVSKVVSCGPEQEYKMTPDQLDQAITAKTKWVILNSPSNPTGAVYTRDELKALADVLLRHPHVHVMSDDIYEHLVYDGLEFSTISAVAPALQPRTLIINGVSKGYSMTGWRIGYGAGPEALIKAMTTLQSQSTSNPSSISQAAALGALTGDQSFLTDWCEKFETRRDLLMARLSPIEGINFPKPTGAFYLYVMTPGLIGKKTPDGKTLETDTDIATYLLDEALVAVVPGSAFGLSPALRFSYAVAEETIEQAAQRLADACAKLSE